MSTTEIIIGKHAVLELLRAKKRACCEILTTAKETIAGEIEKLAGRIPVRIVEKSEMARLSRTQRHHGIAARVETFPYSSIEDLLLPATPAAKHNKKLFILMLDGILDPQNMGSLIRTAHLIGADGVIIPKDNSAAITPAVANASSGATEYSRIALVINIVSTIKILQKQGFWVVGAEGNSKKNLYQFDFSSDNLVLVLGQEGKGLRRLVREFCDYTLSIPMLGKIDSYNVSVAGAIFMSEIMRQRHFSKNEHGGNT